MRNTDRDKMRRTNYRRPLGREERIFVTSWAAVLLAVMAFWAATIFVAIHFLLKVW